MAMAMAGAKKERVQVAIPVFENMTMLDVVGPYEIVSTLPQVDVVFVSHTKGLFSDLGSAFTMQAHASFDEVPRPDVVVVPGGLGTRALVHDKPILDWIRKVHETSIFTTSVCTGALLLGAAGLLQGLDATTHWSVLPTLASYGANPVNKRVVRHGKIITAAGVSSGIDMALQLVALLTDDVTAQVAQLVTEYDPQPPFQSGNRNTAHADVVATAMAWSQLRMARFIAKQQQQQQGPQ